NRDRTAPRGAQSARSKLSMLCNSREDKTMTTIQDNERISAIQNLMATHHDRRSVLKAAAAAGLIPVLSSSVLTGRAAAQDDEPVQGGTFVTLSQDAIES